MSNQLTTICDNCWKAFQAGYEEAEKAYFTGLDAENARLRGDLDTALGLRRMESRRVDTVRDQAEALAGALAEWKCFYCRGRKIESCMCDGQTCRPTCNAGAACHVCEGTGLDKVAAAALRAYRGATP